MRNTVTISIPTNDRQAKEWIEAQGNVSAAVRALIHKEVKGGVTLDDIYNEIKALRKAGLSVPRETDIDAPGTEAAAAAIDRLGL